jgi:hypothetical protein
MYQAPMLFMPGGGPDIAAKIVLLVRAERASKDGKGTYAAHAELKRATGYDVRTIQRAERRLEQAGLLIRRGVSHLGTPRWDLDMTVKADTGKDYVADRDARRREQTAERVRRHRAKQKGQDIETDVSISAPVTTPDVVSNGTGERYVTTPDVVCNAPHATQTTNEPPRGTTKGTSPGGAPPPDPRRPASASPPRTNSQTSLAEPLTQAQDQASDPLPHAHASRCGHGLKVRLRPDGSPSCQFCRRGDTSLMPEGHLADVIHLRTREVS